MIGTPNSRKTLVTGHQGFIGSHLMEALDNATGYDLKSGDNILGFRNLRLAAEKNDTIIHLAADLGLGRFTIVDMITTNIQGTARWTMVSLFSIAFCIFTKSKISSPDFIS